MKSWYAELKGPARSDIKPELGVGVARGRTQLTKREKKKGDRCAERSEVMEVQGIQDTGCKLAGQA